MELPKLDVGNNVIDVGLMWVLYPCLVRITKIARIETSLNPST